MTSFVPSLCLLATGLFYVNAPVVTLRKTPSTQAKITSQAIFSEIITVEKEQDTWVYVTTSDHVSGWAPSLPFIERSSAYVTSLKVSRLAAHLYEIPNTEVGPIATLAYGSKLQSLDETDPRWIKVSLPDEKEAYIQKGDVAPEQELWDKEDLVQFSLKFIGLPYTWGGRSSFGYDCSGFIQMLYNQIGIALPRNSRFQAIDDRFQTVEIHDLEPGDLIFFGKADGTVCHVGMYIGESSFIHSTVQEQQPWIRISHLSDFQWSGQASASCPFRIARQLRKTI